MLHVACSGFPIPVSRYWRTFHAVEIADTSLGIPGGATVRRWAREAGDGAGFSVLAPSAFAEGGFKMNADAKALVEGLGQVCETLGASALVIHAEEYATSKPNRTALKGFLSKLPKTFPPIVLDLPGWTDANVKEVAGKRTVVRAIDPTQEALPADGELVYARLPGPAGKRSRYDEAAVAAVAEQLSGCEADTVFCVFANIDMQTNAKQLLGSVG